jgi:phage terminase Nu1 subunit (DNA packaging protein)
MPRESDEAENWAYNVVRECIAMGATQGKDGLLNSWKEIAVYLGRGVRTVQRWEEMGLPVRRFNGRHSVMADAHAVDVWLDAQTHGFTVRPSSEDSLFRGALVASLQQARLLRYEQERLRENQRSSLTKLVASIAELQKCCAPQSPTRNRC